MGSDAHSAGSLVSVVVSGRTDVGRKRSHNEDNLLVADLSTDPWSGGVSPAVRAFSDGENLQVTVGDRGILMVVADGMGGARAGEVASAMAVSGIHEFLMRGWGAQGGECRTFTEALGEAVRTAGAQIHELANRSPEHTGMGTTVTALGLCSRNVYIAQVGDSRAYIVRADQIVQLTRDQSVVQHLVRAGKLSEAQAMRSRSRNILLQALGTVHRVEVDLSVQPIRRNDRIVLCSDGLTGLVEDSEIGQIVREAADPAQASARLVDLANERGGHDNITLLVAHFGGEALPPPGAGDPVGYQSVDAGPA